MPDVGYDVADELVYDPGSPVPLEQPEGGWSGWGSAMIDAYNLLPVVLQMEEWVEQDPRDASFLGQMAFPEPQDFDPLDPNVLGDYWQFADEFAGASSPLEVRTIKARIDRNEERRGNVARELGFGEQLLVELVNPVNLIPLPPLVAAGRAGAAAGRGATAARGAAIGAGGVGATIAGEEALRQSVDPTATAQESRDAILFGTIFGAGLGGMIGGFAARGPKELGEAYARGTLPARMEVREAGADLDAPIALPFEFQARPTGAEGAGVARAMGFENFVGLTRWGRLKNTGIRAVADFADGMLGDYGTKSVQNEAGIRTEPSVQMAAGVWEGRAADAIRAIDEAYLRYRGSGPGKRVMDMNTGVLAAQAEGAVGRTPDGVMTPKQFRDAVFRAHTQDGIKASNEFVREAAEKVQEFYRRALEDGTQTGLIRSADGMRERLRRAMMTAEQVMTEQAKLMNKRGRTPNESLVLEQLDAWADRLTKFFGRVQRMEAEDVDLGDMVAEIEKRLEDERDAMREAARDIRGRGKNRRDRTAAAQRFLDDRIKRDREVVEYLDRLEKERGLTTAQREYRDQLKAALDEFDAAGEGAVTRSGEARDGDARPGRDETDWMSERERAYLARLEERLAGKVEGMQGPKNEPAYITRYWRIDKIAEDEAGEQRLRRILFDWFKANPLPGSRMDPDSINARVDKAIATITREAEKGDFQLFDPDATGAAGAGFLKSRGIDIPNELVADFIETDVNAILRTYSARFGLLNEMSRKFGDTDAEDAIAAVMVQAARETDASDLGKARKSMAKLRADLERSRDTVTGAIYGTDPDAMAARRAAGTAKAWAATTMMGGSVLSSFGEAFRGMMVHGFGRSVHQLAKETMSSADASKLSDEMRTMTGEGIDVIRGSTMNRFVEMGGPTGEAQTALGKFGHRFTQFAQGPYYIANLLGPWTDATKRMANRHTTQFLLEDAEKLARTGDPKLREQLASLGLTIEDAKAIQTMPTIKGDIRIANLDQWPDQSLAMRFRAAVAGTTRRIIPTASDADLPDLVRGFVEGREYPLLTLPFQFMNFGFASVNKIMISALQGRDRNAMGGVMALLGMGYLIEMLKTPDYIWHNMSAAERAVRAVDRSGITGIMSDVPTMVETATMGQVGVRPLLGLEPYVRDADYFDAVGEVGGPVVGRAADMVRLFVDEDTDVGDVTSTLRRSVPLNDLFYWKGLWVDFDKSTASAIEGVTEEPE